jgi:hypothetical protein
MICYAARARIAALGGCRSVVLACAGALLLAALPAAATEPPDGRLAFHESAPGWLRAVGSLQVPGQRVSEGRRSHYREDCSATLVATASDRQADIIVTAWHCLALYGDLSKPITFTLLMETDRPLVREARRLADGGSMHADWAVLRLATPVPRDRVAPLTLDPGRADPDRSVAMAGYSRDDGLGLGGERLTYDPDCKITHQQQRASESDCVAYRGASGGAVVQISAGGVPQLTGVISRGDSESVSIFVPVSDFRSAVRRFLR